MNVILTGEKHVGKSTALSRALPQLTSSRFGFTTRYEPCADGRVLMIHSLDGACSAAAVRWVDGRAIVDEGAFNAFGASLLRGGGELAVMDEIGKFELRALPFRDAVLRVFDSECDALAVVRLDTSGWMQELKSRSDTVVITVTHENRDSIPDMLVRLFQK